MELQTINQALQTVDKVPALSVSKGPKSGDENKFLAALHTRPIKDASDEEIAQVLRYVMVKVGLRAKDFPAEEETEVIFQHIRENYSAHKLEELRLAFNMAIAGKLELSHKEVKVYDQFTCDYVSLIMNAYRSWAGETYGQLIIDKQTPPEMHPIDTRGLIEAAYQRPVGDKAAYKLFPVYFYDQVVTDGLVHPELYREYLKYAKTEICSEIQQQISPLITGGRDEDQAKIDRLQRQLNEYRAGTRDYEIITRAKQVSVWILLQEARRRKLPALYVRVDGPASLQESY